MQTIIPRDKFLKRILDNLASSVPTLDPQDVTTSLAIIEFANRCMASFEAHFARYGLSQGRFTILMFLYNFPDRSWTPAALANLAGVRRATMTGLLDVLENGRWIDRKPNPDDGRSSEIHLSASGSKRLKKMLPDHFARITTAMTGLSSDDHETLRKLMTKFGDHVVALSSGDNTIVQN